MRVVIIGAGVSGLVNARVLRDLDVEVVVLESRPDVGGVWSSSRGYPGLRIQNDKRSYALSDFPMPEGYPDNPSRAEVQAYLAAYCAEHHLEDALRLSTTVQRASFDPARGVWSVEAVGPDGPVLETADWLIVANGTLSTPRQPALEGAAEFERAGGTVAHAGELGDAPDLAGKHVVLLGFGKSATDIAVAAAGTAASVTLVARAMPWKLPARLGPLSFERLVTSRLGEHLLMAPWRTPGGRVLKRLDTPVRVAYRALLGHLVRRRLRPTLGTGHLSGRLREVSHLVTPGFDAAVASGAVRLHLGSGITRLTAGADGTAAQLVGGTSLPADLLVLATGYRTDLDFLDPETRALLVDDTGSMRLIRHTLPERAPRLLFAGWMNSFRSPIASELQALWIGALLRGLLQPGENVPDDGHLHGVAPTGLSILDQDAWLHDMGLTVPASVLRAELLGPFDPSAYADLHRQLRDRVPAPVSAEALQPVASTLDPVLQPVDPTPPTSPTTPSPRHRAA